MGYGIIYANLAPYLLDPTLRTGAQIGKILKSMTCCGVFEFGEFNYMVDYRELLDSELKIVKNYMETTSGRVVAYAPIRDDQYVGVTDPERGLLVRLGFRPVNNLFINHNTKNKIQEYIWDRSPV
jgi:hypothetical protein